MLPSNKLALTVTPNDIAKKKKKKHNLNVS